MAKLPSYRRIYEEDYTPEQRELVQQLATSINPGLEVLYEQLNGKLVLGDNLAAFTKEIVISVTAAGLPTSTTIIKKQSSDKIQGLSVIKVNNLTNPTVYPTAAVFISFTETTDSIVINHLTGLVPGSNYRINVKIER